MPDHATEAAELLACDRADVATAHALLAIHEALVDIARRLPRPVANDLRAEVQPPAHPGGFLPEPEVAIRGGRLTRIADELRAQVTTHHVTLRDDLDELARPTASPDQENHA